MVAVVINTSNRSIPTLGLTEILRIFWDFKRSKADQFDDMAYKLIKQFTIDKVEEGSRLVCDSTSN